MPHTERHNNGTMAGRNTVAMSVIVPVYNDPEGLETTIESLLCQTVEDYEVLIADNGSTDRTRSLASEYAKRDYVKHIIEDEIQSSYAARNKGIGAAKNDLLCFIDADMWVDRTWLEQVQNRVDQDDISYLGCNVKVISDSDSIFTRYKQKNAFPIEKRICEDNFSPTCCLVIRRSVIDDVGMFDERLISGADAEFGLRVHRAGYNQVYAEDIVMYHPARSSFSSILKREYRIGRGQVQRTRYYPQWFELERFPIDPRNFLPVKPWVAYDSKEWTPEEFPMVYMILCGKKTASSAGQLREWLLPTDTRK